MSNPPANSFLISSLRSIEAMIGSAKLTPAARTRIRTPQAGADGVLYVTTDNGNGTDQLLRVTPAS